MINSKSLLLLAWLGVFLSCSSDSPRTISGKVIGLEGSLTLQNNGYNNIDIHQDGTFSFTTTDKDNGKFDIQVYNEPCPQRCEVHNGSGKIEGDVNNVLVTCGAKTWTEGKNFLEGTTFEKQAFFVDMAMNKHGDMILLWAQDEHTWGDPQMSHVKIYKSEYRNGKWIHPQGIDDSIGFNNGPILNHAVALNNNGEAIIVWAQKNINGISSIYKSEYKYGVWVNPSSLSDSINLENPESSSPQVAINDFGEAIIVWTSLQSSTTSGIFKAEYKNQTWSYPRKYNDKVSFNTSSS